MKRQKVEDLDAENLLLKLLAEKVGSIDPSSVFSYDKNTGICKVGGKKITENQLANLKQEALLLKKGELWRIFTETMAYEAQMRMFTLAKNEHDMAWGKSILHAVGIFQNIVERVEFAVPAGPVLSPHKNKLGVI